MHLKVFRVTVCAVLSPAVLLGTDGDAPEDAGGLARVERNLESRITRIDRIFLDVQLKKVDIEAVRRGVERPVAGLAILVGVFRSPDG